MSDRENPYASPAAGIAPALSKEEARQLDEQLAIARRVTRGPALGMLACSLASAAIVLMPVGITMVLSMQGFPTPWLTSHVISYWYVYLTPFAFYLAASFFGAFSLLKCQNRLIAKTGAIASVVPLVTPLFPIAIPFGRMALVALQNPDVSEAFRRARHDEQTNKNRARAKLFAPASIILMLECLTILMVLIPFALAPLIGFYLDPDRHEQFLKIFLGAPAIRILMATCGATFVTYAAVQMIRGRQYAVCILGACVASIPFFAPCIVFGIPFSLWALVILLQKETRAAFAEAT